MKSSKKLQISQLSDKMLGFRQFPGNPKKGWINTIRTAVNMSLQQMGARMGIAAQSVMDMEKSERAGTISLNTLEKVAKSLNMKLVYGFLPNDGTLEKMIENQALTIATNIVMRTDKTMKLEDQQVSKEHIQRAIAELAKEIKNEMPKYLWS